MSIARSTLYNAVGTIAPLAVTLVTTPIYLHAIGEPRYGVLAMLWLLLGYFGLFDLGLSIATTNALARERDAPPERQARLLATSITIQGLVGLCVGGSFWLGSLELLGSGLVTLSAGLRSELAGSIPWFALCIPLVVVAGAFNGALIAREEFGRSNLIGIVGTLLFQLLPLAAALLVGPELTVLIPAAVLGRAMSAGLTVIAALRPYDARHLRFARDRVRDLLSYGGWAMVTQVMGPVLTSIDQFVIGALLGPVAVARYNVGFNLANRLAVLPVSLLTSMFPGLSAAGDAEAAELTARAMRPTMLAMTVICFPAILLAQPFIVWWIGRDFASDAGPVAAIIVLSIWVNSAALFPFVLLRARGRPDLPAKFHLAETLPFLTVLAIGIRYGGLTGAAWAWAFRVALDAILLLAAAKLPASSQRLLPASAAALLGALVLTELRRWTMLQAVAPAIAGAAALSAWALRSEPLLGRGLRDGWARLGMSS